jgi:hypothetical protein
MLVCAQNVALEGGHWDSRQEFALEDALDSHSFALLEALPCV